MQGSGWLIALAVLATVGLVLVSWITFRLAAVNRLRAALADACESERERATAILESTEEGIFGIDAEGRCTFVNRAASLLLGYEPDELRGKRIHPLIHHTRADGSPFPEEECPSIVAARSGRLVRVSEDVLWRRDGTPLAVACSAAPLRINAGIGGSVVAFTDISEVRRTSESLRFSEERLRALTDTAVTGILIIDEEDIVVFANAACEALFGYEPGELVGRPLTVLMPERFHARHRDGVAHYRRTGTGRIPWQGVSLVGRHRDGHEIPLEVSLGHFMQGGRHFFTGIARDVSERARAEAERERLLDNERKARAQAEAAVRTRDEVLAIVSHDLRNPLNSILLAVNVLPMSVAQPALFQKHLGMMKRSGERMNRLIQDLLDLARMEAGHALGIAKAPVGVGTLMTEIRDAFQAQADAKQQHLETVGADASLLVEGDRDRLLQVLANLVGNAVKFTPEHGRIVVEATARQDHVEFAVTDTGTGISSQDLPRVFDPYWQTQRTARLGAGLGLPISRGIVEAHGGRIWVDSAPGRGSTFRFTIPRAVA